MESLLLSIQMACKTISNLVNRAGLANESGEQNSDYSDGRFYSMKRLDLLSTIVLKNALQFTGKCECRGIVGTAGSCRQRVGSERGRCTGVGRGAQLGNNSCLGRFCHGAGAFALDAWNAGAGTDNGCACITVGARRDRAFQRQNPMIVGR